ncbi:hypothetical protein A4G99_02780 [Haladaptatus sp. R4]|uniref:hypothetical protein n=1 Tax=Haladaptatus sp. R4 TaxID=1679489 RepID=UPI0007B4C094|nr:hypothetical protein [Haladaptatus sp. R4]KZN25434.1 hypothetical protein A4G99_02780 [Haladaptatus sp. R4]
MPSRRAVLASLSAAVVGGGLAGCSAFASVGGVVRNKEITGKRRTSGGLRDETIVSVGLTKSSDEPIMDVAKEWADRFSNPGELHVSTTLNDLLRDEYEEFGYVIGVCSKDWSGGGDRIGCYTASTRREDFNRAQVGDHVKASYSDSSIEIHGVEGT